MRDLDPIYVAGRVKFGLTRAPNSLLAPEGGAGVPCCLMLSAAGGKGPQSPTGDILTIRQLSEYLMVSEKTIYRMLDKRLLPAVRVGAQWRFRKRDVDTWLDERVRKVEEEGQQAVLEELAPSEIDIHPLLLAKNVWSDLPPQPRDELLSWIVMHATLDPGVDRRALVESIRARERLCSTALVKDAAFPHPNEPADFGFTRKRVLLAVAREPVNFNDPNGHRPRVIVVILARTVQGYLLTISRAVKLFGNPALIGRIIRSSNSGDVIAAIREAEERLTASAAR
jgi:nitrogen PTS system EIIA component